MKDEQLLIPFNSVNGNGRMYTAESFEKISLSSIYGVFGERDNSSEGLEVNIKDIAGIGIPSLREDGLYLENFKVLDTYAGKAIKALEENSAHVGISSRGYGKIDGNGFVYDYNLLSFSFHADTWEDKFKDELTEAIG